MEGSVSDQQFVKNNAQRPHIQRFFDGSGPFSLAHTLGSHVVESAREGGVNLVLFGDKFKVVEKDVELLVNHEVVEFEVAVDVAERVELLDGCEDSFEGETHKSDMLNIKSFVFVGEVDGNGFKGPGIQFHGHESVLFFIND